MEGNYIDVQNSDDQYLQKIVLPVTRGNVHIFIIYYQTINQNDKLVYTELQKSMSLILSTKTEI